MANQRKELSGQQEIELNKLTDEEKLKFNNISLFIYLSLKDLNIEDIKPFQDLDEYIISKIPGITDLDMVLRNKSEQVTLLLNGIYDGLTATMVMEKLKEKRYANKVILCRPHVSKIIYQELMSNLEVRIKGFSESQSKEFIEKLTKIKFDQNPEQKAFETRKEIESSTDLQRISTNPLLLGLLCKLKAENEEIRIDMIDVFERSIQVLLKRYCMRRNEDTKCNKDRYLKAGKMAFCGLQQTENNKLLNHLMQTFSEKEIKEINEIGFLVYLPDEEVHFINENMQEYLAAYYVKNSDGEGMELLCRTLKSIRGLKILKILELMYAMSNVQCSDKTKNEKKELRKLMKWEEYKKKTNFLRKMLTDNKTLSFPLPKVIAFDLEYCKWKEIMQIKPLAVILKQVIAIFKSLCWKNTGLEKFLSMDSSGVKKVYLFREKYTRLDILQYWKSTNLDKLVIDYKETWGEDDHTDLSVLLGATKPALLAIWNYTNDSLQTCAVSNTEVLKSLILTKCDLNSEFFSSLLKNGSQLKFVKIQRCVMSADSGNALMNLSSSVQLYLSENTQFDKSLHYSLLNKSVNMEALTIIQRSVQVIVKQLPGEVHIYISGLLIGSQMVKFPQELSNLERTLAIFDSVDCAAAIAINTQRNTIESRQTAMAVVRYDQWQIMKKIVSQMESMIQRKLSGMPYHIILKQKQLISLINELNTHWSKFELQNELADLYIKYKTETQGSYNTWFKLKQAVMAILCDETISDFYCVQIRPMDTSDYVADVVKSVLCDDT